MIKHIFTLVWNKRGKNFLLFLEIFLAFAILFIVFTFAIQAFRTYSSPLGFDTKDSWVAFLEWSEELDSTALEDTKLRLEQELEAKPEVLSASYLGQVTPFGGGMWQSVNDDNGFELRTHLFWSDEDFFETADLELLGGRFFNEDDQRAKYKPVIINRKLWEDSFGGKPILDSIYQIQGENRVVGVVDHFKYVNEFRSEEPMSFFLNPKASRDLPNIMLELAPGTTAAFQEEVNKTISDITRRNDFRIVDLDQRRVSNSRRYWVPLIAALSICAFLIINVALGLFGVLYYTISKRRAEIGLRRTLGATQQTITFQFIAEVLMVAGLAILLASFFAIQLPLLNVMNVPDSNYYLSMLFTSTLILLVVLLCAFYPSQQASRIHPAVALHEE
ncbi:MAG TPA: FtsX-like permease family protein [Saprospiraceae bacterium]|nr:FtsX-like permease family protein [Saprospiraceae bacterium]